MSAAPELQRALAPAAVVVFVVSGCGGSHPSGASGIVSVDASGRIGALRVDVSDRHDVVAFVGRPDAERRGRNNVASPDGSTAYDALGYSCGGNAGRHALPLVQPGRAPKCRTVFFVDAHSGRLGLFYTSQARYAERHGVHVGMATATAERLLHRRVIVGCIASIGLTRARAAQLRFVFDGGTITNQQRLPRLRGGYVAELVLHGKHDPGVFECE